MKINLDKRITDFLLSRGMSNSGIEEFLYPKLSKTLNPYDLNGMKEAVEKIKAAISNNKKILIFGDYDCDGISAASILVLYLKEKNARVDAYIPNRFDDGYGLSTETIDDICSKSKPDLLITVDLGVTAVKEVEELKSRGIDVIVTDHHEPAEEIPDCIVIDAKIPNQNYDFNGLCGAGVALKLVEALENKKFVEKYLDICAIATIGDIVPLIGENRIYSKFGLEKINNGDCLPSIKFLLEKLNLSNITSEDISFKIVPRLNASGRMDNGKKVLDFLIETDAAKLEELYENINEDNEKRLSEISQGNAIIQEKLKDIDLLNSNAILINGDFHQGVLGILASRICHDYNVPSIIFTRTNDGTLKGSGRSVDNVDIHSILLEMSDLFIRFGGHKMAIGLEILPENFDKFKEIFNQKLNGLINKKAHDQNYDIEISDADINLKFIEQIKMLEPFGCENEKPVFMLKEGSLACEKLKGKNFKHFKLHTKNNKQIIAFSSYQYIELLKNKCKKKLFVDLDINYFAGKRSASCKLLSVKFDDDCYDFNYQISYANSILTRFLSMQNAKNVGCYHLQKHELFEKAEELSKSGFGTMIICQNEKDLKLLLANKQIADNYAISTTPMINKQNVIVVKSSGISQRYDGYKNYLFFTTNLKNEHLFFDEHTNVYDLVVSFKKDRNICVNRKLMGICYKIIKSNQNKIFANDIIEYAENLCYYCNDNNINVCQMIFALLVFYEIGVIEISDFINPEIKTVDGAKSDLNQSKLYNEFNKVLWKKIF